MSKRYTVTMTSDEFGAEDFGPYGSIEEAAEAVRNLIISSAKLKDGVERMFLVRKERPKSNPQYRLSPVGEAIAKMCRKTP